MIYDIQKQEMHETTGTTLTFEFIHLKSIVATMHILFFHLQKNSLASKGRDYIITEQPPS